MELQGLLDTKKEYIQHLCDTLAEPMVLYFRRLYNDTMAKPEARGKSILTVFQEQLGGIASWSNTLVRDEFKVAQKRSGCKYIHDLIKAILVTNVKITLLSNSSKADCNKVKLRVPSAENFYHRCILICAREVWKQPYLLYHKVRSLELQQNINELESIARKAIKAAVRGYLPFDQLIHDIKLEDQKTDSETEPSVASSSSASSASSSEDEDEDDEDEEDESSSSSSEEENVEVLHHEPDEDVLPEPLPEEHDDAPDDEDVLPEEHGDDDAPDDTTTTIQPEIVEQDNDEPEDDDMKNIEILSHAPSSHSSSSSDSDSETNSTEQQDPLRRKIILGSTLMKHHRHRHAPSKKNNAFF
jgi:hypothetical protein